MQRFFDESGHYLDLKAARIWDLQRSLNEHMMARGLQPQVETVPVTAEMALLVVVILRLSLAPQALAAIPSEAEVFRSLESLRDRWLAFLVRRSSSKWERPASMRAPRRQPGER